MCCTCWPVAAKEGRVAEAIADGEKGGFGRSRIGAANGRVKAGALPIGKNIDRSVPKGQIPSVAIPANRRLVEAAGSRRVLEIAVTGAQTPSGSGLGQLQGLGEQTRS